MKVKGFGTRNIVNLKYSEVNVFREICQNARMGRLQRAEKAVQNHKVAQEAKAV